MENNQYSKGRVGFILFGGLGNKLFQAAAIKAYCWKNNKESVLLYFTGNPHERTNHIETIFKFLKKEYDIHKAPYFLNDKEYMKCIGLSEEYIDYIRNSPDFIDSLKSFPSYLSSLEFTNIPVTEKDHYITGYFQNTKYFDEYREKILEMYAPELDTVEYILNVYKHLDFAVALHIRVPDGEEYSEKEEITLHYTKGISEFIKKYSEDIYFYVFCNRKIDLKKIPFLEPLKNKILTNEPDVISLYLMSMCNLGCINYDSTFSWWGAYLNKNPNSLFWTNMKV